MPGFLYENPNSLRDDENDCVIRALSLFLGISWDEALDRLVAIAHRDKVVPVDEKCLLALLKESGRKCMGSPRIEMPRGFAKYTVYEFSRSYHVADRDTPILVLCGTGGFAHATVLKKHDGEYRICDCWDCGDEIVCSYWI